MKYTLWFLVLSFGFVLAAVADDVVPNNVVDLAAFRAAKGKPTTSSCVTPLEEPSNEMDSTPTLATFEQRLRYGSFTGPEVRKYSEVLFKQSPIAFEQELGQRLLKVIVGTFNFNPANLKTQAKFDLMTALLAGLDLDKALMVDSESYIPLIVSWHRMDQRGRVDSVLPHWVETVRGKIDRLVSMNSDLRRHGLGN